MFQSLSHQRSLRDSVGRWSETNLVRTGNIANASFNPCLTRDPFGILLEDGRKPFALAKESNIANMFQSLSHQRSLRDSVGRWSETE